LFRRFNNVIVSRNLQEKNIKIDFLPWENKYKLHIPEQLEKTIKPKPID